MIPASLHLIMPFPFSILLVVLDAIILLYIIQFLWSVLHGVVSLRIDRLDQEWAPDLVEFSVDAALRGLVAPAGPNGRAGEVSP